MLLNISTIYRLGIVSRKSFSTILSMKASAASIDVVVSVDSSVELLSFDV